jgi:hypothetical protein
MPSTIVKSEGNDEKNVTAIRPSPASRISESEGSTQALPTNKLAALRSYLCSKHGWFGDYDYLYLITPNIPPLNRKYKGFATPFYGLNDEVPILLTILLGLQHALTMIGSVVSPPLAIAGGAFYLLSRQHSSQLELRRPYR